MRREIRYCYQLPQNLHRTPTRRDISANNLRSTATRHRGDAPTSPQHDRFPGLAAVWCDQPLAARTPRGSHHAREKPQYDSGVPASGTIDLVTTVGANAITSKQDLSALPFDDNTHLGVSTAATSEQDLSAPHIGDLADGLAQVPRDYHRCRELPRRKGHIARVSTRTARVPDVATGKTPPHLK